MPTMLRPTFWFPFVCLVVAAPGQDALTRQALQRIEKVEAAEAKLAADDAQGLARCLADLEWAGKRLAAVVRPDAAHADTVARYDTIRKKLEARRKAPAAAPKPGSAAPAVVDDAALARLDRDLGAASYDFEIVPAKLWNDDGRAAAMARTLERLTARLAAFPADGAGVSAVQAKLTALQQRFAAVTGKIAADRASAEATGQRVEQLLQKYVAANLPVVPEPPYEPERLRAFLLRLQQLRDHDLPADAAFAAVAAQNAAIDGQRASSLRHAVDVEWPRRLAELEQQVTAQLAFAVKLGVEHAEWLLATDAKDRDQVTNRVLGRGAFDQQMAHLQQSASTLAAAAVFDELTGDRMQQAASRPQQAEIVRRAIRHLQQLAVAALDAVRLPAAASTDPELLAIAAATLRQPGYGVGEWQRLVVNAPQVRRERREAWVQGGAVRDTIRLYHYVWDEFQVTTAERVGDDVWLFFNTLKHYHSGDPTTPVGRWVLSQRFESTRILAANVDK